MSRTEVRIRLGNLHRHHGKIAVQIEKLFPGANMVTAARWEFQESDGSPPAIEPTTSRFLIESGWRIATTSEPDTIEGMARALTSDTLRQAVETALAGEVSLDAAYLFGSAARGTAGPLSDGDVGLLMAVPHVTDMAIVDRVADRLCRTLAVPRVDVVTLNSAPLPLRYRVIRDGVLVVARNAPHLERFIVESTLQYLDFAPLRERAFRTQRAALLGHGR